jgi:hypothetical protein
VQLDGLAALDLVPDEDALGRPLEQALVGQVGPARDQRSRGDPEPPRALQELDLRRGAVDDGGGEDDIGGVLADVRVDFRARRDRLLESRRAAERLGSSGVPRRNARAW